MQYTKYEYTGKQSRSSISKIKALLGQLYKYAMQNDIVNKNYAQFIVLNKEQKTEKEIFTDLDIKKLFSHDDDLSYSRY